MAGIDGQAAFSDGGTAVAGPVAARAHGPRRRAVAVAVAVMLQAVTSGCGTPTPPAAARPGRRALPLPPALAVQGTEIVLQAMAQVGKPYRWGGSAPDDGFDCSGLVAHVYRDAVGIRLPRTSQAMGHTGGPVGSGQLADGDLVFFNTRSRPFSHVGIYVGEGRFIHAPSSGSRVRIERLGTSYWSRRYDGARRILGTVAA